VLPYADAWLAPSGSPPQFHLDLDDIESKTLRRLAALRRLNGAITIAERDEEQAARMATRETAALDRCNRIYVCSTLDQGFLHGRGRADVYVLPNALPIPPTLPPPDESLAFTLLFVSTLGYYPNEDAALHFCRDVLPLIRREATRPFRVAIVGPGASPAVQQLGEAPEVRVIGAAPDLLPWYRDASAVVIPLRAGGGTRIKVLEAFSFRRPVVSTTIGVEGIEARHGEHALISDTPEMFARHCLRLMDDPMIADKLTARAFALFKDAYSTEAVTRMVAALPPP
jgi:glycosyltransferase involved in cell wall biosynthesis